MRLFHLIYKSLLFYFRKNLSIGIGVAISTAVITGALIVGDSMRYSLQQTVNYRLGNITHTITAGENIFTDSLAINISKRTDLIATSVLMVNGNASLNGGKSIINNIKIWGISNQFNKVLGNDYDYGKAENNEVIISNNISDKYKLKVGDSFVLKVMRIGPIPSNTPFSSDADNIISCRVKVKDIVGKDDFSRLNLQVSQTAPNNIFVSFDWLNKLLDLKITANLILVAANENSTNEINTAFIESYSLEDLNLEINPVESQDIWELTSGQIFIDNVISNNVLNKNYNATPVLSYFVNTISSENNTCPYSFVSGLDNNLTSDEIIINDWLANDLNSKVGDSLILEYYTIGTLKELETKYSGFIIKDIVNISGKYADVSLMPAFPGMTDAGNCRDWETDIPVDLSKIRDKDEKYWDNFKGIPKAFINIEKASELWNNRFGTYTALRFNKKEFGDNDLKAKIKDSINPYNLNFKVNEVRKDGLFAAGNGTDFSQLFIGLSFFVIVSAIILTVLLFIFNLETRSTQIGTLIAIGYSKKDLLKLYISESLIISIIGAIIGSIIAILYNQAILNLLSGLWNDIVRTSILETQIKLSTLVIGIVISVLITIISLRLTLNKYFKNQIYNLHNRNTEKHNSKFITYLKLITALILLVIGLMIILYFLLGGSQFGFGAYFISGGSLLISGLLFIDILFSKASNKRLKNFNFKSVVYRNISNNHKLGLRIIILLSLGTFIVISTGSNKKNFTSTINDKHSGTGGFLYIAESNIPVLEDLENNNVLKSYGINENTNITQFRVRNGDNASCLNLNRVSQPGIIAVNPVKLDGRFSFVSKSDSFDDELPWNSLNKDMGDVIPAIMDQTAIQWGLGKKIGDTLSYTDQNGNDLKLILIGGLGASVFQGNVIVSEKNFQKHFPASSGNELFLIDGGISDTTSISKEFIRAFRDYGFEMELAHLRLGKFKSVENTYLTIFLLLGVLGLVIGTIGLSIVLIRNINERKAELSVFMSLGFSKTDLLKLFLMEYSFLLISGTVIGSASAFIAVLPSILNSEVSFKFLLILIAIIIIHGILWIIIVSVYQLSKISPVKELSNE